MATPPAFSRTGRPARWNLRIIIGSRECRDGSLWLDFRSCSACRASVARRQLVLSLRRSRVRHVHPPSRSLSHRRIRPRPRLRRLRLRHLLRRSRLPPRALTLRRIRRRLSPSRIRPPSAISRPVRLTRLIAVPTVTPRRSRPHVRSTSRELVTRQAVALLTAGADVLLLVPGIVRVRRAQGWHRRWFLLTKWAWGVVSRERCSCSFSSHWV